MEKKQNLSNHNKEDMSRYQFQPFYIKIYRRLRYQPLYFCKALYVVFKSLFVQKNNRESLGLIFLLTYVKWEDMANLYYTFEFNDFYCEKLEKL